MNDIAKEDNFSVGWKLIEIQVAPVKDEDVGTNSPVGWMFIYEQNKKKKNSSEWIEWKIFETRMYVQVSSNLCILKYYLSCNGKKRKMFKQFWNLKA